MTNELFSGRTAAPSEIRGIVSDLDGVVYRGTTPIPEAIACFQAWHAAGIAYCFVTNNSTRTPEEVAVKLQHMGLAVAPEQVVTSATATTTLLSSRWPAGGRAYVIGAQSLKSAVGDAGFELAESKVDCVVVGLDREFDYPKMRLAVRLLLEGAMLIGTNPDLLLPSADGFEPGAGSLLAGISASSRVTPHIIGKPKPDLVNEALARMGVAAGEAIMLGDQLWTDIVAGQSAGVFSVLVRTGVPEDSASTVVPDLSVADLMECRQRLQF